MAKRKDNSELSSPVEPQKDYLTIREAALFLGMQEQYVRTMIRNEKLSSRKAEIGENLWRHEIPIEELIEYKNSSRRAGRADGRTKYVLYATEQEYAALTKLIQAQELGIVIEKAYNPERGRENYLKQKAKKAARNRNQES